MQLTRQEKAKQLRYKRPALASMGYDAITSELWEIIEACSDVQWFIDTDEETLLDALDGDEEEEFEFRMAFADLSGKAERLMEAVQEYETNEDFDTCTVALIGNRYNLVGFDGYEEDYFSICGYDSELAYTEAGKRLMQMTKKDMLATIGQSLGILVAFLDVRQDYDYLKAAIDVIRGQNRSLLQQMTELEELYDAAAEEEFCGQNTRKFDALADGMPERMWIE